MGETELQRHIRKRQEDFRQALADELRRVVESEGLSLRAIGRAVGVDSSQLSRVLRGKEGISHEALVPWRPGWATTSRSACSRAPALGSATACKPG